MTDDDQLRRLLSDAVSDIEPQDRLPQIRDSVRSDTKVVPMSRPRSWIAVVGVAAAVAVIGGVAFAAGALQGNNNADDHTPVGPGPSSRHSTAPVTPPTSSAPTTPTSGTTAPPGTKAYAVYYVGDNPAGKPVLFREFHSGPDLPSADPGGNGADVLTEAVQDALGTLPLDPDYVSPWQDRVTLDYASYQTTGAGYTLQIALNGTRSELAARPSDVSAAEAKAAVQQLVYTAQAAIGKRMPVHLTVGHRPPSAHETLWGIDITQPIPNAPVLQTLSLVNISSPNEGQQVSGQLTVTGVNNAFEGTSVIYLERNGKKYLTTPVIGGFGPDKLYPWTTTLDLTKVQPGGYTLVAENDDPSGQGNPAQDTRTLEVK
jgi:hypothetical protein